MDVTDFDGFIRDFQERGWASDPYPTFYRLVQQEPHRLPELIRLALAGEVGPSNLVNEAISFITQEEVVALVEQVMHAVRDGTAGPVHEDVLLHVSLQFPALLHPHLTTLFEHMVDWVSFPQPFPWRESGEQHLPYLRSILASATTSIGEDVLKCALETRTTAAFQLALQHPNLVYDQPALAARQVGFEWQADAPRPLYPAVSYHLRFPDGILTSHRRPVHLQPHHPTWHLEGGARVDATFGGWADHACPDCQQRLIRMVTLPVVPDGLGVTSVDALDVVFCVVCFNAFNQPFFRHDDHGRAVTAPTTVEPAFTPFQEGAVQLVPTPARWFWQDWGVSNARQNLNRVGGHPAWIQDAGYPACPDCDRTMTFLLQLEGGMPGSENVLHEGIVYACWCDACRISTVVHQQT